MKTFHFLKLLSELDESYIIDTMQSHERNRKVLCQYDVGSAES